VRDAIRHLEKRRNCVNLRKGCKPGCYPHPGKPAEILNAHVREVCISYFRSMRSIAAFNHSIYVSNVMEAPAAIIGGHQADERVLGKTAHSDLIR